tara:strand:+ start:8587 stop:9048 length:462 start_codon:yes stop_codon:yes gene_type:complete
MSYKKNSFILILFLLSLSCSKQFNLEKISPFVFEESYYQSWIAGVRGGGSGINIYLTLEVSVNKNIQIEGIYFKEKYCRLLFQGDNKYLGNIITNQNKETNPLKNSIVEVEKGNKPPPFNLEGNDAVFVYLENKIKRYVKLTLNKKEIQSLPM